MHNLQLLSTVGVVNIADAEVKLCSQDTTQGLYVASCEGLYSVTYDGGSGCMQCLVSWSDAGVSTEAVVACDFINPSVCITTTEGDVILYNVEELEVEIVGSTTEGISASCWSPDQELLVLVTGDNKVSLLSTQYLPIAEFSLLQQGFGEAPPVALGWGKKETQFHGTEGKKAAKIVTKVESGLAQDDDGKPKISWRGDGQMFVINYVDTETNSRKLRIANREGVLQCTSESISKLEQTLSWKPSGSLITSTQMLPNKYQVVFFEKNGLRHGEFNLPHKPDRFVREIMWNMDSTVLMIWFHPTNRTNDNPDCSKDEDIMHYIQLWTVNNYSWYLKDELTISNVQTVLWDNRMPMDLYIANNKCIAAYSWTYCINKSMGRGSEDLSLVSVINGNRLLMTPFRKTCIPPPVCAYEVSFPDQIHCVIYPSDIIGKTTDSNFDSNSVCVIHGTNLTILSSQNTYEQLDNFDCKVDYKLDRSPHFKTTFPVHRVVAQYNLFESDKNLFNRSRHLNCVWLNATTFYCINLNSEQYDQSVIVIDISGTSVNVRELKTKQGPFLNIACHEEKVYFLDFRGNVYELQHERHSFEPTLDEDRNPIVFQSLCVKMKVTSAQGTVLAFGLSMRNRLYYGNKQLIGNCSSFHIHNDHLLVTTTSHQLLMIPLDRKSLIAVANGNLAEAGQRKLERGAKLVTALSSDSKVVLQMPRGNLETIHPRILLVHRLKRLLDEGQYYQVVELMRKHRVDMNLIYDHNPASFLNNCETFIQLVSNAGWIDLFIVSLKNEDTTMSLYLYNYKHEKREQLVTDNDLSKVDLVCIAVRKAMIRLDEDKYLLPILSSYVKMDTMQMDEALRKVKNIKDSNRTELTITAEEGLRHLLYIADANILCDVALGTYDFNLVMMVFEKSQKDPKEFLPFLNNLKSMEPQYMKYRINVYLKRYRRAFECIKETASNEQVDECVTLVKKEKNFSVALEEFIPHTHLYRSVAEAYGDYNLGKGYYGEAAILYERAGKLLDALEVYKELSNWRRAFIVAIKLNYSRDQLLELYEATVEVLKEKKMYAEAAIIYKDYLKNDEEAVACLTRAQCWDDAIRMIYHLNRMDLIETNVLPELLEHSNAFENEIASISETFSSHCSRLIVVRENMEKEQNDLLDGRADDNLDSDMYCDTSTVTGASHSRGSKSGTGSNVSGRTYRSAKNRKKLERKKFSTKEGSSYEDFGLITELHALIIRADGLAEPVGAAVYTLYSFEKDSQATQLQTSLHNLLRLVESKQNLIWPSEDNDNPDAHRQGGGMLGGAHMSTAEILQARQRGSNDNVSSAVQVRLKQLEPTLRHAPKPTRASQWALGFLHKKESA